MERIQNETHHGTKGITLAVKCAPQEDILSNVKKAGIAAVELFLYERMLSNMNKLIKLCRNFSFKYAVHAPNDSYNPGKLARLIDAIGAKIVIFHNIYWEKEWDGIIKSFKNIRTKLCLENTFSVHEPLKYMRRYGMGRCLDLEHLQMECSGIYEEEFLKVIRQSSHIHLTGYIYGTNLWHTHIHHSKKHSTYLLNLLKGAGYSGFVVSEARISFQTYNEFKKLNDFYKTWELSTGKRSWRNGESEKRYNISNRACFK